MLKYVLRTGIVFSLPATLFDMAIGNCDLDNLSVSGSLGLHALLGALPGELSELPSPGSSVFFEVCSSCPEKMVRATPSHVAPRRTVVRLRRLEVVKADNGKVAVRASAADPIELDVFPLCGPATFGPMCCGLVRWQVERSSMVPRFDLRPEFRWRAAVAERLQSECSELVPIYTRPDNWQEQVALLIALTNASAFCSAPRSAWLPFGPIDGVCVETVSYLSTLGVLEAFPDEFGELVLAANLNDFAFEIAMLCHAPAHVVVAASSEEQGATSPKLMSIMSLVKNGWSRTDKVPEPLAWGSPREVLVRMPLPSASYFRALLIVDHIFRKAPPGFLVYHNMPASYYTCLLELDNLDRIHALGVAVRGTSARVLDDMLSHSSHGSAAALGDDLIPELEDTFGEAFVPPGAPDLGVMLDREPLVVRHPMCVDMLGSNKRLMVYFDRCTHASGRQRAFVTCPVHAPAERCRRYVFVHHFETARHAGACLCAWALMAPPAASKAEHVAQSPSEQLVRRYLDRI